MANEESDLKRGFTKGKSDLKSGFAKDAMTLGHIEQRLIKTFTTAHLKQNLGNQAQTKNQTQTQSQKQQGENQKKD